MPRKDHILRIIGGNWRSRKVSFPDIAGIRPTPDRVRETLFNWLQGDIAGARCLELYAGSGVLSLEALSRGAAHVSIVDEDPQVRRSIEANLRQLGASVDSYAIFTRRALDWLSDAPDDPYDIIFLDPPFDGAELSAALETVASCLSEEGAIYVESSAPLGSLDIPHSLAVHREKRAGRVHYGLLRYNR